MNKCHTKKELSIYPYTYTHIALEYITVHKKKYKGAIQEHGLFRY